MAAASLLGGELPTMPRSMRRGYGPLHTSPKGYRRIYRLNRSQRWRPAQSYRHARSISPYPDRVVR